MSAILHDRPPMDEDPLRARIRHAHLEDESESVRRLLELAGPGPEPQDQVERRAISLAQRVREAQGDQLGVEVFLHEYGLTTREGVMLMCLAEALLRIPDKETADRLIRDKLAEGDWERHLGHSGSVLVNASTFGLMLTGRFVRLGLDPELDLKSWLQRLVQRLGEPVLRQALLRAMRVLGRHFVLGQTIGQAMKRAAHEEAKGYRFSYDMLGEAARTMADARRYHEAYREAIKAIGESARPGALMSRPGISIKLSALHPRYEIGQHERLQRELLPAVLDLLCLARRLEIAVTIDAEEADRLEPSLDLFAWLAKAPDLSGWNGLGLAVQAYQKRAVHVITWLHALAGRTERRIPVRLVKGAYWDTEIKRAQENGLEVYPVFTRKVTTDVSYLACAQALLAGGGYFYPQFATHNAQTLAAIIQMADGRDDYEFQRLHGMGEALYQDLADDDGRKISCRVYAPVGSHTDLLPYLVRRLLENGANTSFVNRILDKELPLERLVENPLNRLRRVASAANPTIPLPPAIYGASRLNAKGLDLADPTVLEQLAAAMAKRPSCYEATADAPSSLGTRPVLNPARHGEVIGTVIEVDEDALERAFGRAVNGFAGWSARSVDERASLLEAIAGTYETHMAELMALLIKEAGKTLPDALAEVREAVDFLRYYAIEARRLAGPLLLPGPTGERNALSLHARGVFVTISPWNFPLAIFTGQIAAALVVGNSVVAKPAPQTPLIAARAIELMRKAGLPPDALVLVPGGADTGARLVADPRTAGVAFTGSTWSARLINQALAAKEGAIVPLIAETGGQNTMIVDSSALAEQVVKDVLDSAFRSAGQRCSALRILCLQADIADRVLTMLAGAMDELVVGDPAGLATDVGPVIDRQAQERLAGHAERMRREARLVRQLPLGTEHQEGWFFAPQAFEIDRLDQLEGEVFGPILHILRYPAKGLDALLRAINGLQFGLTLGVHSRIEQTIETVASTARVGNIYVNRNMIGAVVGVQPFGGEGLSGTGPKAGGPHYLPRFACERTLSVNTTAIGGNAGLLSQDEFDD